MPLGNNHVRDGQRRDIHESRILGRLRLNMIVMFSFLNY